MTKSLRNVAQLLITSSSIFAQRTEIFTAIVDLLEHTCCLLKVLSIIAFCSAKRFDEPTRALEERTFLAANIVVHLESVVAVNEACSCEASSLGCAKNGFECATRLRVVWVDEETSEAISTLESRLALDF